VTEQDALTSDDLLGTVTVDAGDVFGDADGITYATAAADTGRFKLTYLVENLAFGQ
jgi:hypothetical protein